MTMKRSFKRRMRKRRPIEIVTFASFTYAKVTVDGALSLTATPNAIHSPQHLSAHERQKSAATGV